MLCKVCGSQIPDDAQECEFCGASVSDGAENNSEPENINDTAADKKVFDENEKKRREQREKMLQDKQKQLSEIERRRNEKRQRQKRRKALIIALICALAVGAAGAGAYYIMQTVNSPNVAEASPTPETTQSVTVATPVPQPTPEASPEISMNTPAPNTASGSNTRTSSASDTASAQRTASTVSSGGGASAGASSSSSGGAGSSSSGSSSSSFSSGGAGSSSGSPSSSSSSGGSSSGAGIQSVSNSGIVTSKITSQLASGGEVIYNSDTGRYLMTFISGGVRYYANVSAGSTTEQIKDNPYTITAEPTKETYNGNTVYEITSMTNYSGDYLLGNSGTALITEADIRGMSKYDLALARNEIYARHGRKFRTPEYNAYFSNKSWYKINPNYNYSDDNSNLNEIEIKNVNFILEAEKR